MIFQSLVALYDRLAQTGQVPPYGFSIEDVGFVITIDKQGNLIGQPEDLRVKINAQKFDFRISEVPYTNKVNVRSRAAATTPNFMVDKADYIFGMSGSAQKKVHHESFIKRIGEVCGDSSEEGVVAVKAFLKKWISSDSPELDGWKEISGDKARWVAFRLQGDACFVHERPGIKVLWSNFVSKEKFPQGISLSDGKSHDLQKQYAQFPFGTGVSLSSCKDNYSWSYGKEKGENAPISVDAEFKSSAALKYLFRSRTQRLRIGDEITVFWAEKKTPMERFFGQVLNPSFEDKTAALSVQKFMVAVRNGNMPSDFESDGELKFHVLGFSVGKARLALRFYYASSVTELMERLRKHFQCLEMEHSDEEITFPGISQILKETARETKNISPVLAGALLRSVLTGTNYPQNLYQGVLGRIRAEQNVTYFKASILKAVLKRNHNMEVPVALDRERKDVAYLVGRLFAVLEKAQKDALGNGINTTIKDRFYGAACTTPACVFPRLIQLAQHHVEKGKYGKYWDKLMTDLIDDIKDFPKHLSLVQQGEFAIGYYQQKKYRNKKSNNEGDNNE